MEDIPAVLNNFIGDHENFKLEKLSGQNSMVVAGDSAMGDAHTAVSPLDPTEVVVYCGRGFTDTIKTSPVKEILKETRTTIEFKTMSGAHYRLSK